MKNIFKSAIGVLTALTLSFAPMVATAATIEIERSGLYDWSCSCTEMGVKIDGENVKVGEQGLTHAILNNPDRVVKWASAISGASNVILSPTGGSREVGPDGIPDTPDDVMGGQGW